MHKTLIIAVVHSPVDGQLVMVTGQFATHSPVHPAYVQTKPIQAMAIRK